MFNKAYIEKLKHDSISCASVQEKRAILNLFKFLGFPIYEDSLETLSLVIKWSETTGFTGHRLSPESGRVAGKDVLMTVLSGNTPQKVEIKLNDEYSATYTQGSEVVSVGCQKIAVSKLQELIAAINKVNNYE